MTEKRTTEEILNALEKSDKDKHFPSYTYEEDYAGGTCKYHRSDLVELAMHEYAAQELADYKARLKELIKERIDKHENNFYDNVNDSHAFGKLSECRYLLELIDQL